MTVNYFKRAAAIGILAIGALLLHVNQSQAQQNSLVFPWQAQGGRDSGPVYQPAPTIPTVNPAANIENSRAYYPSFAPSDKVLMEVTLPANAKITFQGAKTTQTGEFRRFESPSIATGHQYTYTVQATWTDNGQEVSQSRSFAVQPGDVVHINISRGAVNVRSEK